MPRRFPPLWSIEETAACFIVKDRRGQALAYFYYEEEPGRRSAANLPASWVRSSDCKYRDQESNFFGRANARIKLSNGQSNRFLAILATKEQI